MPGATLEPSTTSPNLAGKYLTFTVHRGSYGIGVLKVREIIRLTNITAVPQMPPMYAASSTFAGRSSR